MVKVHELMRHKSIVLSDFLWCFPLASCNRSIDIMVQADHDMKDLQQAFPNEAVKDSQPEHIDIIPTRQRCRSVDSGQVRINTLGLIMIFQCLISMQWCSSDAF